MNVLLQFDLMRMKVLMHWCREVVVVCSVVNQACVAVHGSCNFHHDGSSPGSWSLDVQTMEDGSEKETKMT